MSTEVGYWEAIKIKDNERSVEARYIHIDIDIPFTRQHKRDTQRRRCLGIHRSDLPYKTWTISKRAGFLILGASLYQRLQNGRHHIVNESEDNVHNQQTPPFIVRSSSYIPTHQFNTVAKTSLLQGELGQFQHEQPFALYRVTFDYLSEFLAVYLAPTYLDVPGHSDVDVGCPFLVITAPIHSPRAGDIARLKYLQSSPPEVHLSKIFKYIIQWYPGFKASEIGLSL
ncbi:hypothetical protein TWF970_010760 [Orbilia oligospora]|uniref:Uncharacterized protein n=1 Tax=Orbilia oligospora TaxID=2813651 RepID=A0A7C8R238_ORBOL|nr:hypothetical protein TWF970_010760 [Orbilia oligospora]